ncbi:MAG: preprotein translocase subunit SecG [Fastidiosipilaceae bacterium]|jgi:preprotein translocase subunit SecG
MGVVSVILAVVDVLVCIALVILIIAQEGQDRGMGAIGGGSPMDTFFNKNTGRTKEQAQRKSTLLLSVVFVVVSIILYVLISM